VVPPSGSNIGFSDRAVIANVCGVIPSIKRRDGENPLRIDRGAGPQTKRAAVGT
jgi:hypothetical protein